MSNSTEDDLEIIRCALYDYMHSCADLTTFIAQGGKRYDGTEYPPEAVGQCLDRSKRAGYLANTISGFTIEP